MREILLIVPFYKQEALVYQLGESLKALQSEFEKYRVSLLFLNDSPDYSPLGHALSDLSAQLGSIKHEIISNSENLGFLKTVNKGFDLAVQRRCDALILNSDTYVFPGLIAELVKVAYSDPIIGFVSPRSNNATMCTFPHGSEDKDLTPQASFDLFKATSQFLPEKSYVPIAVGFCLFIKWNILVDFGFFDPIFGKGYSEENDLIMRANRVGYRAALANRAFVWHQGEASFGSLKEKKKEIDYFNHETLVERFPEYPRCLSEYFKSPEYLAESLVSYIPTPSSEEIRIGFDMSNVGNYHNGTFEASINLVKAIVKTWPKKYKFICFMHESVWFFHKMDHVSGLERFDTADMGPKVSVILRVGQPFDAGTMKGLIYRAPIVCVNMLDTIAADCGYLRIDFNPEVWHYAARWLDVIFTISKYTADQVLRRHNLGANTKLKVSLLSTSLNDYRPKKSPMMATVNGFESQNTTKQKVLVIGNKFEHKGMAPALKALEHISSIDVLALGAPADPNSKIKIVPSGNLTDEEMDAIFHSADFVVFPSHYEGFGFPLVHALARNKPIFVRDIPCYHEILASIPGSERNVFWFDSHIDLVQKIQDQKIQWEGPDLDGETLGWERSAKEVLETVESAIASASYLPILDRLRWFRGIQHFEQGADDDLSFTSRRARAAKKISNRIVPVIEGFFGNPAVFMVIRIFWRVMIFIKILIHRIVSGLSFNS